MSNATIVKMFVEAKSKFGVLNSETKKWMNPLNKTLLSVFELGKGYEVTVEKLKGDDGKVREYITDAKALTPSEVKKNENQSTPVQAKAEAPTEVKPLSFSEKDARILVQGIAQAVLQSPLMNMIPDNVTPLAYLEAVTKDVCDMVKRLSGTK